MEYTCQVMLKIRLMRIGTRKRPFYRVVVVDERNKRTGSYIDLIGTYNPLTNPKEIILDQAKITDWTKKGAQMSHGFLRILGKAPQKPPRKPKKAKEEKKPAPKEEVTVDSEQVTDKNQESQSISSDVIPATEPESTEIATTTEAPVEEASMEESVADTAEPSDESVTDKIPEGEGK